MAEIPVERKQGGIPWWIPLLLLLLLIPILFFLFRGCSPVPVANVNTNGNANRTVSNANTVGGMATNTNTAMSSSNANTPSINVDNKGGATGAKVTDLAALTGDRASFVGRGAELKGVKVNRVLSDRVFTVTAGSGEMFMMLDESKLNAGGKEEQIKIKPGQVLNLTGDFRNVPSGEVKDEAQNRDLNQKEYAQMKGQQVYLHVNTVSDAK